MSPEIPASLSSALALGASALNTLRQARTVLPIARSARFLGLGAGPLLAVGAGALGVALAVPTTRRMILQKASSLVTGVQDLVARARSTDEPGPPPLRTVDHAPRPRPRAVPQAA